MNLSNHSSFGGYARTAAWLAYSVVVSISHTWAEPLHVSGNKDRVTNPLVLANRPDDSSQEEKLQILRSNANISVTHSRNIYWINNEEVIFVRVSNEGPPAYMLSVWNIRTNQVRLVRDLGGGDAAICFSAGHLLVGIRTKGRQRELYYGSIDSLEKIEADTKITYESCQPQVDTPKLPAWTRGRAVVRLERVAWGFVDFGGSRKFQENNPITLYLPGAAKDDGIPLPLKRRETGRRFRYFEFADAHFVESTYWQLPRPRDVPYRVYWLHRDGRVEAIADIPFGPWSSGGSTWTEPTKRGVILVSANINAQRSHDLGHAGLYLVSAQRITKLLSAWIEMTAVSPNGCGLAFDYSTYVTDKDNILSAVDICGGEGK